MTRVHFDSKTCPCECVHRCVNWVLTAAAAAAGPPPLRPPPPPLLPPADAQRSWIALIEKGLSFEIRPVDLANKDAAFVDLYHSINPDPASAAKAGCFHSLPFSPLFSCLPRPACRQRVYARDGLHARAAMISYPPAAPATASATLLAGPHPGRARRLRLHRVQRHRGVPRPKVPAPSAASHVAGLCGARPTFHRVLLGDLHRRPVWAVPSRHARGGGGGHAQAGGSAQGVLAPVCEGCAWVGGM